VLLAETDGLRHLPIWIGRDEARLIAVRLLGAHLARPLTHDLVARVISALGGSLSRDASGSLGICPIAALLNDGR
jgi:bifunctional DNase/RNase